MAHLTFGGNAFWGQAYDPEHTGDEAMDHALPSCEPIHGGLIDINPEIGHPAGGGWPDFIVGRASPRCPSTSLRRLDLSRLSGRVAPDYLPGGQQRAARHPQRSELPTDDKSAIERQITAMKQMIAISIGRPADRARLDADRLLRRRGARHRQGQQAGDCARRRGRLAGQLAAARRLAGACGDISIGRVS